MTPSKISVRTWLNAFLPPILWALVIFILSSQSVLPGFEESALNFVFKKLSHITVYAVLYFLLFRGVTLTIERRRTARAWVIPFLICFIYAISDEIHQSFVPGRYPATSDIGYDMLGASVALLKTMNCI